MRNAELTVRGRRSTVVGIRRAAAAARPTHRAARARAATAAATTGLRTVVAGSEATGEPTVQMRYIKICRGSRRCNSNVPSFAAATVQATRLVLNVHGHAFEPRGQLLLRFDDELDEVANQVAVLVVEEGRGDAEVAHAPGTTDAVDVLLHVRGQVEVDDVLHVRDVETASGDRRRHQDGSLARAEALEGVLSLALAAIAVNRGHGVPLAVQILFEGVGAALRLDEHQRELVIRATAFCSDKQSVKYLLHKAERALHVLPPLPFLLMFEALSRSRRKERLSCSSTQTIFCVMFSDVEPTRPTAKKM